jgi:hypothetical protein
VLLRAARWCPFRALDSVAAAAVVALKHHLARVLGPLRGPRERMERKATCAEQARTSNASSV